MDNVRLCFRLQWVSNSNALDQHASASPSKLQGLRVHVSALSYNKDITDTCYNNTNNPVGI